MTPKDTLTDTERMLLDIKAELAAIRTDVSWLKRLFGGVLLVTGALFGVDVTGVI